MAAREDILHFHHDIPAMKKNKVPDGFLADALFENFVGYASTHWDYAAESGALTSAALLAGTGRHSVDCAKLRGAFEIMCSEDLRLTDVQKIDLNNSNKNGYFIAKYHLKCFDSKVRGNLGNLGSATFNLGCFFSTHYFVKCGGKYYDACLSTTYRSAEEPIFQKTKIVGTVAQKTTSPTRLAGVGKAAIILRSKSQHVPGFGSVWEIVKLDEVKSAFSKPDVAIIKLTPELQGLI